MKTYYLFFSRGNYKTMMSHVLFFFTLPLSLLFWGCQQHNNPAAQEDINPNKSSELALLMRKIEHETDRVRNAIIKGDLTDPFPEEFKKIHTAIPTDSMEVMGEAFHAMSDAFLNAYEKIYLSDSSSWKVSFNAMVVNCANCHKQYCPGPLKKINKLPIQ